MIHIRVDEGMPKNLENTTGNMSSCTVLLCSTINIPAFIYAQNDRKMEHDSKTAVLFNPSWDIFVPISSYLNESIPI